MSNKASWLSHNFPEDLVPGIPAIKFLISPQVGLRSHDDFAYPQKPRSVKASKGDPNNGRQSLTEEKPRPTQRAEDAL